MVNIIDIKPTKSTDWQIVLEHLDWAPVVWRNRQNWKSTNSMTSTKSIKVETIREIDGKAMDKVTNVFKINRCVKVGKTLLTFRLRLTKAESEAFSTSRTKYIYIRITEAKLKLTRVDDIDTLGKAEKLRSNYHLCIIALATAWPFPAASPPPIRATEVALKPSKYVAETL